MVDGVRDRAGGDDVVFLDEHHVVQAEAMVLRAAAARGVFLREPQARQRLARVENPAAGAGDGFDVTMRGGGGRRQRLQEIERGAFAGEDGARGAGQSEHGLIRDNGLAVGRMPFERDRRDRAAGRCR